MSTLYFFTGENGFALRQEKNRWVAEFAAKHGQENLLAVDGSQISYRELLDEVSSAPFISSKRLVIVNGVPKFTREEIELLRTAVHPDCLVLFCDAKPDKRLQAVKALQETATLKEFPLVRGKQLQSWLLQEARVCGAAMDDRAADALLGVVGDNQDMLQQEIAKLATYAGGAITAEHVSLLAVPSGEQEIWNLTSLLARGDTRGALGYAATLMAKGEDAYSLWNVLLWYLRCLVGVSLAVSEGHHNPAKIASVAGVPFPSARTILPFAQSIDLQRVRELLDWAVQADIDLKTGGYKATGEAPQELTALIDELIIMCCALQKRSELTPLGAAQRPRSA